MEHEDDDEVEHEDDADVEHEDDKAEEEKDEEDEEDKEKEKDEEDEDEEEEEEDKDEKEEDKEKADEEEEEEDRHEEATHERTLGGLCSLNAPSMLLICSLYALPMLFLCSLYALPMLCSAPSYVTHGPSKHRDAAMFSRENPRPCFGAKSLSSGSLPPSSHPWPLPMAFELNWGFGRAACSLPPLRSFQKSLIVLGGESTS